MKLRDRVAIVTGGSRGIGKAIVLGLIKEGAKVIVNYCTHTKEAKELVDTISNSGYDAFDFKADVSNKYDVEKLVFETLERYGKIDILVNNAGIVDRSEWFSLNEEKWDHVMKVNSKGIFLMSQEVSKYFASQRSGKIINITSQSGFRVNLKSIVPYCVSKAAANMLTKAMAVELAPYNINVNAVAPGIISTDLTKDVLSNKKELEKRIAPIPLGKVGLPEDVVGAVIYLASDESNYVTGTIIVVDGGYLT